MQGHFAPNLTMNQTQKSKSKARNPPKKPVSAFISKTFEILEDRQFPDIIDWNSEGTAIVILKPLDFSEKVLSLYFKHRNLTSFVRQLNMYNFHKQRTPKIEHIYCHELFQRGKKYLLQQIKRKTQDQPLFDSEEANEGFEPIDPSQDITTLLQEKQTLKRINNQAISKINSLEGKIHDLAFQNQTLKDQLNQQSGRDKILISLMANILKKFGIPPTELSSIMRESYIEPSLQQSKNNEYNINQHCVVPVSFSEPSTGLSGNEVDVADFLNLSGDSEAFREASTVLNNKTNLEEEKSAMKDISMSSRYVNSKVESSWNYIASQEHPVVPYRDMLGKNREKNGFFQGGLLCLNDKKDSKLNKSNFPEKRRVPGREDSSLGKRRYEEPKEMNSEKNLEMLMKKRDISPSIKKHEEIKAVDNVKVNLLRQNKEIDEEYSTSFLNFKPMM